MTSLTQQQNIISGHHNITDQIIPIPPCLIQIVAEYVPHNKLLPCIKENELLTKELSCNKNAIDFLLHNRKWSIDYEYYMIN